MKPESGVRNNLRAVRARLGLSQQELAQAVGVTRQTIGGIEAGLYGPTAGVALRLAKSLGCRVEELFWLEEEVPTLRAVPARTVPSDQPLRLTLAPVGGRWVAHPLMAEHAFRTEMVPCDGVGTRQGASPEMTVELLDDPESLNRTVVLAGCTPVLSLWARAAERWYPGLRVPWTFANSMQALESLARGEVHAAGLHLRDAATGEYNVSQVRQFRLREAVVLLNLGVWEEGFVVQQGNPKRLMRGADLAQSGVSIVNREEGSGSRLLLETVLRDEGVPHEAVQGFDQIVRSHTEVAQAVAVGRADAGVSSACVAAAYNLGFVPLSEARYDLAFVKSYLDQEPVRQLLGTLDHRWVRSQLRVLGAYDISQTGEVVAEVPGAAWSM